MPIKHSKMVPLPGQNDGAKAPEMHLDRRSPTRHSGGIAHSSNQDYQKEPDSDASPPITPKPNRGREPSRSGNLTPVTVSPAESDTSQGPFEDIWDKSERNDGDGNSTPLTPPERHRSTIAENAESPSLGKTNLRTRLEAEARSASKGDDGYFPNYQKPVSRKIFPQITETSQGIAENQPKGNFAKKPNIHLHHEYAFKADTESSESAKTEQGVNSEPGDSANDVTEEKKTTSATGEKTKTSVTDETRTTAYSQSMFGIPFNIQERLRDDEYLCVAWTKKNERCKRRLNKLVDRKELLQSSLKALGTYIRKQNYAHFLGEVKDIMRLALCGRTHCGPALEEIDKTLEALAEDGSTISEAVLSWANAISRLENKAETHSTSNMTDMKPEAALSTSSTELSATTAVYFEKYQPEKTKSQSINEALRALIIEDLTKKELKSGFIYVFGFQDIPCGHLKIGVSINPSRRLKEWNWNCKHEHVFVMDSIKSPHARRVERLIHTELKEIRKSWKCAACPRVHREWFEVSKEDANRVFQKWSNWMKQHPYEIDHTDKWRIKPSFMETLLQMTEPLELMDKPSGPIGPKDTPAKTHDVSPQNSRRETKSKYDLRPLNGPKTSSGEATRSTVKKESPEHQEGRLDNQSPDDKPRRTKTRSSTRVS